MIGRPFDLLTLMQFAWALLAIIGFAMGFDSGISIVFLAIIIVCIYSEVVARLMATPVSVFVMCVIIPLVPGRSLYYSMQFYINGSSGQASRYIFDTLMISGTIAMAIAIVASATSLFMRIRHRF